ncbi:ExeA family protein [Chitinimonas naiadis]
MYYRHFGLAAPPFGLIADPAFYYASRPAREALETLRIALAEGEGFVKITGEVGTGKTLLCHTLMAESDPDWLMLYLPSPALPPDGLLLELGRQLEVVAADGSGIPQIPDLHRAIAHLHAAGLRVILCIDEAQIMSAQTLEALRLLSNLESRRTKLLQIVLFGQPELNLRLQHPQLRQLKQRITFEYHLQRLSRDELRGYLRHRLHVVGGAGPLPFSRGACYLLRIGSRGLPRLVNVLCHKALMLAYGRQKGRVEWSEMLLAIKDSAAVYDLLPRLHWLWIKLLG